MDLITRLYHIELYEVYAKLLTEKQQDYFKDYYYDDLSFAEIAEKFQVSRNAVFDQIHKVILALTDYENKLGLLAKKKAMYQLLEKLEGDLNTELKNILEGE